MMPNKTNATNEDSVALINEYGICKKKLESKKEAVKILMKEIEEVRVERDIYKNKVSQLQIEINGFQDVLSSYHEVEGRMSGVGEDAKKIKTLNSLLQFSRDENLLRERDLCNLKQLYTECQKDNLLLHSLQAKKTEVEKTTKLSNQSSKESLIVQLESAYETIQTLEQELQICKDEKNQVETEKDVFHQKNVRLNAELNYVLHNDDQRIVDVDSLLLENKYLKEVVKQYKVEKTVALDAVTRYKTILKQRKSTNKRLSYLDLTSPKGAMLHDTFVFSANSQTVKQLQQVNKSLTENISEKNIALKHQRNTNRILGVRVSELEKKLRTLEVSGLWSHEQRTPRAADITASLYDTNENLIGEEDIVSDVVNVGNGDPQSPAGAGDNRNSEVSATLND